MNELKKKQLEIAKRIVEQGDCSGYLCQRYLVLESGPGCGLFSTYCREGRSKAVGAAKAYIKDHSKISKKDLLDRIEKLEEKVDSTEKATVPGGCSNSEDARNLKRQLEQDILDLVVDYEEKTGMRVSEIDLETGPFLRLDIFKREGEDQCNNVTKKNHIVKVQVNL